MRTAPRLDAVHPTVVVIGNYDGVHVGHRALLERALAEGRRRGERDESGAARPLPVVVVTLWPHPVSVFAPERAPQLLDSLADRIDRLKDQGVHEVRVVRFNKEVAAWSPEHFVDTILMPLHPRVVVVGSNFTFGARAAGTVDTLRELGRGRFEVLSLDLVGVHEEHTCSTLIRAALAVGDVETAAEHLGRPFRVRGVVVVGDQRGRQLGFPTANLGIDPALATPADGVYAGWVTRLHEPGAIPMPAAISVGSNPTFVGAERRVESYVLDRTDLELYGEEIAVDFVARLRGMLKFDGVQPLVEQMHRDVAQTRVVLGSTTDPD